MAPSKEKALSKEELASKKRTRKIAVIIILAALVGLPSIWFGREYFATESTIKEIPVVINGKERLLRFSEKTSGHLMNDNTAENPSGISHYAYFLELTDPVTKTSLSRLRFKSPASTIEGTPEIHCYENGDVWIISASSSFLASDGKTDYILKFSLAGDAVKQQDFSIGDSYTIRNVQGDKVMLSEGKTRYTPYNAIEGGIYLDLQTGKIVDDRKK